MSTPRTPSCWHGPTPRTVSTKSRRWCRPGRRRYDRSAPVNATEAGDRADNRQSRSHPMAPTSTWSTTPTSTHSDQHRNSRRMQEWLATPTSAPVASSRVHDTPSRGGRRRQGDDLDPQPGADLRLPVRVAPRDYGAVDLDGRSRRHRLPAVNAYRQSLIDGNPITARTAHRLPTNLRQPRQLQRKLTSTRPLTVKSAADSEAPAVTSPRPDRQRDLRGGPELPPRRLPTPNLRMMFDT